MYNLIICACCDLINDWYDKKKTKEKYLNVNIQITPPTL